jgi:hypothetical protein
LLEERQPRSKELEERDHVWTGEEDAILQGILNPSMGKTAWKKLARDHFPHMSAQLLKQHVALLGTGGFTNQQTNKEDAILERQRARYSEKRDQRWTNCQNIARFTTWKNTDSCKS